MDMVIGFFEWLALFAALQQIMDVMIILGGWLLVTPLFLKWWPLVARSPDAKWAGLALAYWAVNFGWIILQPDIYISIPAW